ncbi:helix-turn-helix transcriptional regulator [Qipengyuania spongiae]|uniref:AlpA family phage regulatory protein n=1 Tax=Qipengyuania spongiae TaxID=2909673 RepID=A0ABY5T1I1_9SPHN|nr:AlpA family phage regulatory protein [Qipengyuania spongiae]UVI39111.1 AlpA family phage regulatory protein [Qipengyuania spongiae]
MLQTVDQVAEKLTISRATVWRYVSTLPDFPKPLKLSRGCSRWRAEEVDQWLETRPREAV